MTILEQNKLIAEAIGWVYIPFNNLQGYSKPGWYSNIYPNMLKDTKDPFRLWKCRSLKDLKFHEDFNLLMMAVQQIEKKSKIDREDFIKFYFTLVSLN